MEAHDLFLHSHLCFEINNYISMVLDSARLCGSFLHRSHLDKERPNLLFSSDIPGKIATCVAELHLYHGGKTSRRVDLLRRISCFDVILELNALLLRNPSLTPSELVRRNLVFVAKSKAREHANPAMAGFAGFPEVWQAVLGMKKANEIFVVSLRLNIDEFTIDLANVDDISLTFHDNDDYQSLLLCGGSALESVKAYVCRKLLLEIKTNTDISIDITRSSTILQDLPVAEPNAHIEDIYNPATLGVDKIGLFDSTLDGTDVSQLIDKQLVFVDDPEFDSSSDDEFRVLLSDDSGKCTANEDDEYDMAHLPCGPLLNILDVDLQTSTSTLEPTLEPTLDPPVDLNLPGLNSLGELNPGLNPDLNPEGLNRDLNPLVGPSGDLNPPVGPSGDLNPPVRLDAPAVIDAPAALDAPIALNDPVALASLVGLDAPVVLDAPAILHPAGASSSESPLVANQEPRYSDEAVCEKDEDDSFVTELENLRHNHFTLNRVASTPAAPTLSIHTNDAYVADDALDPPLSLSSVASPISGELQRSASEAPLRKKSSFAFVSHDDNQDLEYAFRDKSSTVPQFIKRDKKFKFIKVGKVQKFVNMFEEKVDSRPSSNAASRVGTRPPSPLKAER